MKNKGRIKRVVKPKETENNGIDVNSLRKLNDTAWQEGLSWRKRMLETIAGLRHRGINDNDIFRELKRCGLTNHTANRLMDDAEFFKNEPHEITESATDYMKKKDAEKEKDKK
jgi:hypothetical protein